MKSCLFTQHSGLGDIIFLQKLKKVIIDEGYHVFWPVISQYTWLSEYMKEENVTWEHKTDNLYDKVIDTMFMKNLTEYHMDAKYHRYGLDWDNWQDYFIFKRNMEKEQELFTKVIGKHTTYDLVNLNFASPPLTQHVKVEVPSVNKKINIDYIEGYTPFDWCTIIEKASNLYLVDTCFTWISEKLDLQAEKLYLISRLGCNSNDTLRFFKQKWKVLC